MEINHLQQLLCTVEVYSNQTQIKTSFVVGKHVSVFNYFPLLFTLKIGVKEFKNKEDQ